MAGTGRSVMMHQFSQVPHAEIPRSSFDRSHGLKTTFNEAQLIPIFVDEVLPGDTFNLRSQFFGRLATPIFPFMDNMYLDVFYFFVPYRLIWTHFVNFFGEQANPTDTTSYLVPTATSPAVTGYGENTLQDYMGLPTKVAAMTHSNLPMRAYNLIWNQWFRDQNLQNSVVVDLGDGPDTVTNYSVLSRGKRHDYFTSCLPFPQKGPAVQVPLGSLAPVRGVGVTSGSGAAVNSNYYDTDHGSTVQNGPVWSTANEVMVLAQSANVPSSTNIPQVYADLSTATAATINQLRQAFQIQKIYERDARGGTRYTELIRAHFGVTSPDARLQRSEYLGGGRVPFNINPIAQTSATSVTGSATPLGNLAAMGTVHSGGAGFTKSFTEHGVLLGICNVTADLNYQDGLERMWSRSTRFDFYWPALAMIGEQAVLNQEIFAQGSGNPAQDVATFGYQERYAEYRYKLSKICGQFRSNCATPLDTWHLAQHFTALPLLNSTFITDAPPVSRVVAVPTQPRVLLDVYHNLRCARPMPVYSVPGMIDHF